MQQVPQQLYRTYNELYTGLIMELRAAFIVELEEEEGEEAEI